MRPNTFFQNLLIPEEGQPCSVWLYHLDLHIGAGVVSLSIRGAYRGTAVGYSHYRPSDGITFFTVLEDEVAPILGDLPHLNTVTPYRGDPLSAPRRKSELSRIPASRTNPRQGPHRAESSRHPPDALGSVHGRTHLARGYRARCRNLSKSVP